MLDFVEVVVPACLAVTACLSAAKIPTAGMYVRLQLAPCSGRHGDWGSLVASCMGSKVDSESCEVENERFSDSVVFDTFHAPFAS